ncbi:MAG TPA: hypothetical protein VHS55_07555 [Solirubrobacteraceae bacterium]|nr:hypothetical protein [Solirubrobacteraceae bacterium]
MAGEDEAGRTPLTAEQAPQAQTQAHTTAADEPVGEQAVPSPGFGERGRMRRRARFLRKARELAYRDLGGLVYDLHRFGQRNDQVVLAKLTTLGHIDAELRALEDALHEIKSVTVLREVGIAACPRCAAIHGNEDRFCPGCGLSFDAGADRPLSTAPVTVTPQGETSAPTAETPQPVAAPGTPAPASPPAPRPAAEPLTTIERPPAPILKPTAPPVAAKPQTVEEGNGKAEPEDEPTQILHPPAGSA